MSLGEPEALPLDPPIAPLYPRPLSSLWGRGGGSSKAPGEPGMSQSVGAADPLRFYLDLQGRASVAACAALFRTEVERFGLVAFACGEIDVSDRGRNVMFIAEWPEDWRRYYAASNFVERDPILNALSLYR